MKSLWQDTNLEKSIDPVEKAKNSELEIANK